MRHLNRVIHRIQAFLPLGLICVGHSFFYLALIHNHQQPGLASALTVAYAAFAGLPFVMVGLLWALFKYRSGRYLFLSVLGFIAHLILVVLANQGRFSVV